MTTFSNYSGLPKDIQAHLTALEDFIGDLDGRETDDGTIDAEDAVVAFNGIVALIASLPPRQGGEP